MTLTERQVGAVTVLDVSGGLKLEDGATELADAVRRLLQHGRRQILLNAAGMSTVDSAGLGALVQAHVSVSRASGALRLVNTPKRLRDIIAITKLSSVLKSYDDEHAALQSFQA